MLSLITRSLCFCMILLNTALYSEIRGKLDLAPAYVHIDVLESGKTVKAMHMGALKGDATVLVWQGVGLKTGFLAATGQGDLISYAVGVGNYTPLTEKFSLFPSVGVTFSYLSTHIDLKEQHLLHLKERFRSEGPYIALEFAYKFNDKWTLIGMYQYAWSKTHTKITATRRTHPPFPLPSRKIFSDRSHSDGASYSLGIDYTINDHWSVNAGGAYNLTLSHEKHGLRGYGFKLGTSYYF
jgi:hypothetical protein